MTYTVWNIHRVSDDEVVAACETPGEAEFFKNQLGRDEHYVKEGTVTLDNNEA